MSLNGRFVNWLQHGLWHGLDWLFPPQCVGCGAANTRWCVDCHRNLHLVGSEICSRCGQILRQTSQFPALCHRCREKSPNYSCLRSYAVYEGSLRKAIHQLKYGRDMALGEVLSTYLVRLFRRLRWDVMIVVPVPLALDRLSQRGYNQTSLLARPMAIELGLDFVPSALQRVKETRAQVGLSAQERKHNVFGAFSAKQSLVSGKKVLVVDDVTTTGSTLDACASALLDAGASEVLAITLARASGHSI